MENKDITVCAKENCGYLRCAWNQKHIRHYEIPHIYAELEGTSYCYKKLPNVGGAVTQQDTAALGEERGK